MSNYASSHPHRPEIAAVRIGTNGSAPYLSALLLMAYVAAARPESKRVRRWVRPGDSRFYGGQYNKRIEESAPGLRALVVGYRQKQGPSVPRQILAYNHDDQHWVEFNTTGLETRLRTMDRGLQLKPVTDPVLAGLVLIDRCCQDARENDGTLTPEETRQACEAVRAVLPQLQASDWLRKVTDFERLLTECFTAGTGLRIS